MALSHELIEYREAKMEAYGEYKTGAYTYDGLDLKYLKIFYQRLILAALSADQTGTPDFPLTAYKELFARSLSLPKLMQAFKENSAQKIKEETQKIEDIWDQLRACEKSVQELEDFFKSDKAPAFKLEVNKLICIFQQDPVFNFLLGIHGNKSVSLQCLKKGLENIKNEIGEKNSAILISRLEEANKLDKNKFKVDAFFVWQIIQHPKRVLEAEEKITSEFEKFVDRISRENIVRVDLLRAINPVYSEAKEVKRLNDILKKITDAEWKLKMNPWEGSKRLAQIKDKYEKRGKKFNIAFEKANKILTLSKKLLEKNKLLDFKSEPVNPLDLSGSSLLSSDSDCDLSQSHSSLEAQSPSLMTSLLEDEPPSSLRSASFFPVSHAMPVIPETPESEAPEVLKPTPGLSTLKKEKGGF